MKARFVITALLLLIGLGGGWLWFNEATSPVSSSQEPVIFVVAKGEDIRQIAERLKAENLIRSPLAFYLIVRKENLAKKIQAGDFRLTSTMTTREIAEELTHGTLDIWVTIPEGWRNGQIAMLLNKELNISEAEFLALAEEGFMFPDTYLFPKEASAAAVVAIMRDTFATKVQEGLANELDKSESTLPQIITLASIVEREAKHAEDRPLIAGVLSNRLERDMLLQADATLQYIKGYDEASGSWWTSVFSADKELDSPYNTYQRAGLPPGPIANPGTASIRAALNPAKTDYFYYLSEEDGTTHYAKTLEEHNANIRKYLKPISKFKFLDN